MSEAVSTSGETTYVTFKNTCLRSQHNEGLQRDRERDLTCQKKKNFQNSIVINVFMK